MIDWLIRCVAFGIHPVLTETSQSQCHAKTPRLLDASETVTLDLNVFGQREEVVVTGLTHAVGRSGEDKASTWEDRQVGGGA